jgi:hypothetical protein
MRRLAPWVLVVACGHTPPPKPPPAEIVVNGAADVKGKWVSDDDMDFGYVMTIDGAGAIDVVTDRNKLGRCEQKGALIAVAANKLRATYDHDECHRELVGHPIEISVSSFTGDLLTITLTAPGIEERHTYRRAPSSAVK